MVITAGKDSMKKAIAIIVIFDNVAEAMIFSAERLLLNYLLVRWHSILLK